MRTQQCHYIWIGDRKTTDLNKPNQDLMGPLAMESVVDADTTIHFWCLGEYKNQFSEIPRQTNIVVRSIDDYLRRNNENALVQRVIQLKSLLFSEGRGDVRDRVTFKEAMSLLILYLEGGYAFDTNVLPVSNEKIKLPDHPAFHMVAVNYPAEKNRDQDVWALYSPRNDSRHAESALRFYVDNIMEIEAERAEKIRKNVFNTEHYKTAVLDIIIKATCFRTGLQYWFARHLGAHFPVQLHLEAPKIIKHYFNAHAAADRMSIPALHFATSKNDIVEVKRLLLEHELALMDNFDINHSIETEKYSGITALNIAVFYGYKAIAALLLAKGADANIVLQKNRAENPGAVSLLPSPLVFFMPLTPFSSQEASSSDRSTCKTFSNSL